MPVLFVMAGWSAKWHQPSARFVEALRPYIPDAEPQAGLVVQVTQRISKKNWNHCRGCIVALSPLEIPLVRNRLVGDTSHHRHLLMSDRAQPSRPTWIISRRAFCFPPAISDYLVGLPQFIWKDALSLFVCSRMYSRVSWLEASKCFVRCSRLKCVRDHIIFH